MTENRDTQNEQEIGSPNAAPAQQLLDNIQAEMDGG